MRVPRPIAPPCRAALRHVAPSSLAPADRPQDSKNAPGAHQSGIPIGRPPHRLCLTSGRTDRGTAGLHGDARRVQVILCVACCTSRPVLRFTIRHLAEREKIKGSTNQSSAPLARSVAWLARLASRWALGNLGCPALPRVPGGAPARPRRDSLRWVSGNGKENGGTVAAWRR